MSAIDFFSSISIESFQSPKGKLEMFNILDCNHNEPRVIQYDYYSIDKKSLKKIKGYSLKICEQCHKKFHELFMDSFLPVIDPRLELIITWGCKKI